MKNQITINILIYTAFIGGFTHAEEDGFLGWLQSPEADLSHTECTTNLLSAPSTDIVYLEFSPSRHHYAVLKRTSALQSVEAFEWGTTNKSTFYSHVGKHEDHFVPDAPFWHPDGDRVNISYCHEDLGVAHIFDYDVKTGKLVDREDEFRRLETSTGIERPSDRRFSAETPAWSLGGKKFRRRVQAERAGYAVFEHYRIDKVDSRASVVWNKKEYDIFLRDTVRQSPIILDNEIIGLTNPRGRRQGVWFYQMNGNLIAKVLPLRSRRAPSKTISFGKRKLKPLRVTDLGDIGILIKSTDGTNNYWDVLDPRKWEKEEEKQWLEEYNRREAERQGLPYAE